MSQNLTITPPPPSLTAADLETLRRPFQPRDHEFYLGRPYVSELAVTTRIEEIDPAYSFEIVSTVQRDRKIIVTARMTVLGVARDGIGMAEITYMNDKIDKKTGEVLEVRSHLESGEAEKSAATDALKRCARLFGVGRYLLACPDEVRDQKALADWLWKTHAKRDSSPTKSTEPVGTPSMASEISSVPDDPFNDDIPPLHSGGGVDPEGDAANGKTVPFPMKVSRSASETLKPSHYSQP